MAAPEVDLGVYKDALLVLGTAGVVVPLVHRFRISPILGFLLAGAVLGPNGLGALGIYWPEIHWFTVTEREGVSRIAEFGVVFLLFVIGLELSLPRLLTMRRLVFGLGGAQVVVSTLLISVFTGFLGKEPAAALIIGAALALSSTAIVIEVLAAQQRLSSSVGRTTFAILLFQDLAVVPLLLLVNILGSQQDGSLVVGVLRALGQGALAIIAIVIVGRLLLQPLFRIVAATGLQELFIAAVLFVAVATSLAGAAAGLSMALGAFVAGLLLAETEYRRAIEATMAPFKGLLLGVFFFSVGMSLDIAALLQNPVWLLAAAAGHIVLNALVIIALCRLFRLSWPTTIETALLLGPTGEFAFVILGLAMTKGLVKPEPGEFALAVAALTMILIPGCAYLGRALVRRFVPPQVTNPEISQQPPENSGVRALVVGYGRVGQLVSSMLERHHVPHLAIDRDPVIVGKWRREGRPVYFGDARQQPFLKLCGIDRAAAVIVTTHTQSDIVAIVRAVRALRSDIVIVSRARDAQHARALYDAGVTDAVPETIEASLQLSEAALVGLGVPAGPVIASIHDKRDEFRQELQDAATKAGRAATHAIRPRKSLRSRDA